MTSFEKEYGPSPKKKSTNRPLAVLLLLTAAVGGFVFVASGELDGLTESVAGKLSAVRAAPEDANRAEELDDITVDPAPLAEAEPEAALEPEAEPEQGVDAEAKELRERLADLETQVLIDHAIRVQPRLTGADVWVTVQGEAVSLNGTVVTGDQAEAAKKIAETALNGAVVTTALTISGPAEASTDLARRVEYELYASDAFHLPGIEIAAEGGAVTLTGSVRATAERLLAGRIAEEVPGVAEVRNDLEVDAPRVPVAEDPAEVPAVEDPGVDG